jgi:hypothetical protein
VGIGQDVPLHISENGFPTGPGRSPALQALALSAMVRSVDAIRTAYNVSDYRWFDLRDSASSDPNFESQYGITNDRYSPKPAFATYRDLISELGGGVSSAHGMVSSAHGMVAGRIDRATCRPSPLRIIVPAWKVRMIAKLQVAVDGRRRRAVRPSGRPWVMRIALAPGRHRLVIRQFSRTAGRSVGVRRTTVTICGRST